MLSLSHQLSNQVIACPTSLNALRLRWASALSHLLWLLFFHLELDLINRPSKLRCLFHCCILLDRLFQHHSCVANWCFPLWISPFGVVDAISDQPVVWLAMIVRGCLFVAGCAQSVLTSRLQTLCVESVVEADPIATSFHHCIAEWEGHCWFHELRLLLLRFFLGTTCLLLGHTTYTYLRQCFFCVEAIFSRQVRHAFTYCFRHHVLQSLHRLCWHVHLDCCHFRSLVCYSVFTHRYAPSLFLHYLLQFY